MQNPRVTFEMNTGRKIVLELLPDRLNREDFLAKIQHEIFLILTDG